MRKFKKHMNSLVWKSYLQRRRRWRYMVAEIIFALLLFVWSIFVAKPVMLTPLEKDAVPPLEFMDILATLERNTYVGYAPNTEEYQSVMKRTAELLQVEMYSGATEDELNEGLYSFSQGSLINFPVIWIIWKPIPIKPWRFSIRSSERARVHIPDEDEILHSELLHSGFIAVQVAVSTALLEHVGSENTDIQLSLTSIPLSPLMQEENVRRAIAWILVHFTVALIPPVMETQALVVHETANNFKRALRLMDVGYQTIYLAWVCYGFMSTFPVGLLAGVALIYMFRWIDWIVALLFVFSFASVLIMMALVMAMFHNTARRACSWSILFVMLQVFLAELVVQHRYDARYPGLSLSLQLLLPPLGLVHGFNQFATLDTGRMQKRHSCGTALHCSKLHAALSDLPLTWTVGAWLTMTALYFLLLMLLQRTIGRQRAIGGQVSWKSIIFKKAEDKDELHPVITPTGRERDNLQEVDELTAKAVSFSGVSKSIMGVPVLSDVTLDIYRGEYTMIHTERVQDNMLTTFEDLLTGLTVPDKGTIHVLGQQLDGTCNVITSPYMMGYCHHQKTLIDDLTVEEHLAMFIEICLWNESTQYVLEYQSLRVPLLLASSGLEGARRDLVRGLHRSLRAQLCWALTLVMEPRIIFLPYYAEAIGFVNVIRSKIMQYRGFLTIIKMNYSTMRLEYSDRVFLLDHGSLVFGGSPAYMFFKYGRDYRIRILFHQDMVLINPNLMEMLARTQELGARTRAFYGSMLVLRTPEKPTAAVAALLRHLYDNKVKYGITSIHISLADFEEVVTRAVSEHRNSDSDEVSTDPVARKALKRIFVAPQWRRKLTTSLKWNQLKSIGWKYMAFHVHYISSMTFFVAVCIVTGTILGRSLSMLLHDLQEALTVHKTEELIQALTVESLRGRTTMLVRADSSPEARSVARAYVMSDSDADAEDIEEMAYTAFQGTESLMQYLMIRATYSPQEYVYMFAYGIDITKTAAGFLIQALYSPLHDDKSSAARSIARAYTSLMRHYTGKLDSSIDVIDQPLGLDMNTWTQAHAAPPLLVQFLLIIMVSYIIRLPSNEYGFFRHVQVNASNFSPYRYWLSLFFYDYIVYLMMVLIIVMSMIGFMMLVIPDYFSFHDIVIVPVVLAVYGAACVPQAYLFSLGRHVALNTMFFVIINVVFSETTVVAMMASGEVLHHLVLLMGVSPQFNVAYALVKIKQIFLYNNECRFIEAKNLCPSLKGLHKCCERCGVMQKCFVRKSYFASGEGVVPELTSTIGNAVAFTTLLLLWEYRVLHRLHSVALHRCFKKKKNSYAVQNPGAHEEQRKVIDVKREMKTKKKEAPRSGQNVLLVKNLCSSQSEPPNFRNVYLEMSAGEAVGICGLKRHGRLRLCEVISGYIMPSFGDSIVNGTWNIWKSPHQYSRHVSFCHGGGSLPGWMTVQDALTLIATLRGVPRRIVHQEVIDYIEALELSRYRHTTVDRLSSMERARVRFLSAVVGAPRVVLLEQWDAHQRRSVRRAMAALLLRLRRQGHALLLSSNNLESLLPVAQRLVLLGAGRVFDAGCSEELVRRHCRPGCAVVLYVKNEFDALAAFQPHFDRVVLNDATEVLVNVQILDEELDWATIFERMELLKQQNEQVYSYVVAGIPIDYVYSNIITTEICPEREPKQSCWGRIFHGKIKHTSIINILQDLRTLHWYEARYNLLKLKELPWSVIFYDS